MNDPNHPGGQIIDQAHLPCGGATGKCTKNKDGSPGGFVADTAMVEKESHNLFWERNRSFLEKDSQVCDRAQVRGSARVDSQSKVYEDAQVYDFAKVYHTQVYGHAQVYGKSRQCRWWYRSSI